LLGYKPAEVMMVAAPPDDLKAAQSCGLKAGLVPRPLERGPAANPAPLSGAGFDVMASDFVELAGKLA